MNETNSNNNPTAITQSAKLTAASLKLVGTSGYGKHGGNGNDGNGDLSKNSGSDEASVRPMSSDNGDSEASNKVSSITSSNEERGRNNNQDDEDKERTTDEEPPADKRKRKGKHLSLEELRERKRMYNRRSASRARQRHKSLVYELEQQVGDLYRKLDEASAENVSLKTKNEFLSDENQRLLTGLPTNKGASTTQNWAQPSVQVTQQQQQQQQQLLQGQMSQQVMPSTNQAMQTTATVNANAVQINAGGGQTHNQNNTMTPNDVILALQLIGALNQNGGG